MKKILLLTVLLIFACSSDDSDSSNSSGNSINPPAWIQGLWLYEGDTYGYEFRADDFCWYVPTGQLNYTCFKSQLELFSYDSSATQNSTENSYQLTITLSSYEYHYEFQKISADSMTCIGCIYGEDLVLIKQ